MAQTVGSVIARVSYEVADETFDILKKKSYIYDLDRVYRYFVEKTHILTNMVRMFGDGVSNEYDLFGPVFDGNGNPLGINFGDNVYKFYRIEYNGTRATEADFDFIMNMRNLDNVFKPSFGECVNYAIKQYNKNLRLYLQFVPGAGDYFDFWYYENPIIGTINSEAQSFPINDRNVDDLVLGLTAISWKRMMFYYLKESKPELAKFANDQFTVHDAQWKAMIEERTRNVAEFAEEITPTSSMVDPDDIDFNDLDLFEEDFSNYEQ